MGNNKEEQKVQVNGHIPTSKYPLSFQEEYWLGNDGKSVDIETLDLLLSQNAQSCLDDFNYSLQKLREASKIPLSRLERKESIFKTLSKWLKKL